MGVQNRVIDEVIAERNRQDKDWGVKHDMNKHPIEWAVILAKQVGQLSDESLRPDIDNVRLRKQFVQIAAVAVAGLEAMNRRQGHEQHETE